MLNVLGTEHKVQVAGKRTLLGLFLFLRSKYVFHTHGHYHFFKGSKNRTIVCLWHGMPLKTIELLDPSARRSPFHSDYAIATSEFFQKVMAQAFGMPESRVLVTGLPRNDALRVKKEIPTDFAQQGYRRMAVWMPTFRRSFFGDVRADSNVDVVTPELLAKIDQHLDQTQTVCFLKLHPMDHLNADLKGSYANIRILRSNDDGGKYDTYEDLLAAADCLMTDFSSVYIDFALTRRPIGFYVPDQHQYIRGFIGDVMRNVGFPGAQLNTPAEIAGFLSGAICTEAPAASFACMHSGTGEASCSALRMSLLERGHLRELS